MEVVSTVEHEDGSATLTFMLTDTEQTELLQLGIYTAIKRGLAEAKAEFDFTQGETK